MPPVMVIEPIAKDERLRDLKERVAGLTGAVHVSGLWGSSAPMLAALVRGAARSVLYVTAHPEQADNACDDIELFLDGSCRVFPAWEALPGEGAASGEISSERLRLCQALHIGRDNPNVTPPALFIVAPIQALMQPVPSLDMLQSNTVRLTKDMPVSGLAASSPEALLAWAVDRGYERLDLVESPGDVAHRGDIIDLFEFGDDNPLRVEFFDEVVESIRRIDITTQRSIEPLTVTSLTAMPVSATPGDSLKAQILEHLPRDALIVLDNPVEIQEMGETLRARLGTAESMFSEQSVLATVQSFAQMCLYPIAATYARDEDNVTFEVNSVSRFSDAASDAVSELCRATADHEIYVFCDNDGERQRLDEMIREQADRPVDRLHLHVGVLHQGFEWCTADTIVVPHHEIFHRQRQRRRIRKIHAGRALESWMDLKVGDLVVHVMHGIAIYRGLKTMKTREGGRQEEFLTLEFADKAVLHVPTSQIDLVQQYIGVGGRKPQLSKLGGKRWSKTKQMVADSVEELAESLLRVQAIREQSEGIAYPSDTQWQREFEASFLYEETEDQITIARDIRDDLMRSRPMDRLVCGDVGYGKTELAMRASFKVVEFGRQVGVLVPTTVLAEQHHESFRERFAEYPFEIACLSRFRSAREQAAIVDRVKKGQVDIVIGTHRLLSKDVSFANLGLVVIDEEQRFGVEHKERLKAMRATVDVLTLTATPIPRTLHMSMVGIRDISSLQTPPVDRRAIATQVRMFDEELIRHAILREMNRDGQVYFVHNFVRSIAAVADTVKRIVPEARVLYGHGQMGGRELEEVMHRFVRGEADVLVSTTIIESGIDIPAANTILINRAERFGLADLHQLRGRVGRSAHRAYCYLMLSPKHTPTTKAAKRLKTIEEFSELGAGFRIALRDLEIRGAGNLLGKEQSGHIGAVGYELFCKLLDQSVRRMRNEPEATPPAVHVDLGTTAHVPDGYIRSERSRIEVYRRIVGCTSIPDLHQLEADLVDAFGAYPAEVDRLLQLAEIRIGARKFGIRAINLSPPDVVMKVDRLTAAEPLFLDAPGTVRMPDPETVHLRLPPGYLASASLLPILRNMFRKAMSQTEIAR